MKSTQRNPLHLQSFSSIPRAVTLTGYTLLLIVAFQSPTHSLAQEHKDFPKWARNRLFWISSDSPMMKHIIHQPGFNRTSIILQNFVGYVESTLIELLRNGTPSEPETTFKPCNFITKMYGRSIKQYFKIRKLPLPEDDCITDLFETKMFEGERSRFPLQLMYDTIMERIALLEREKDNILNSFLYSWEDAKHFIQEWTRPALVSRSMWRRAGMVCERSVVGFVRINRKWYARITYTNMPVAYTRPEKKRMYINEFIHIDPTGKETGTLPQRFPKYKEEDEKDHQFILNTTTNLSVFGGKPAQSIFYAVRPEENPAIVASLEKADVPIQQAVDALSPSSIAILFLPVVLNLVPIALITHVSTKVLFVYTVMSDVLTVIPLAIKGVELIVIGNTHFRSVATRLYAGMSGLRGQSSAAELWVADCRAEKNYTKYGIAFVAVALTVMVLGILLELWARKFSETQQKRRLELNAEYNRIHQREMYDDESYIQSLEFDEESLRSSLRKSAAGGLKQG